MNESLNTIAKQLVSPTKGILAADARAKSLTKKFAAVGVTLTPDLYQEYKKILITAPGIEKYISGVIMNDEYVREKTDDGVSYPDYLTNQGIIPGIKVDEGLEPFGEGEEEITKGLEGLDGRLKEYSKMGLKFTKWRGVVKISGIYPTDKFLDENLGRMAKFAKISQDNGFVPIVEPDILLDGNHTTTRCEEITTKTLKILFDKLSKEKVNLSGLILKTSMVLPGKDSGVKAAPLEVAQATMRAIKTAVPAEVAAVVFLSGGQLPDEIMANLNEIELIAKDAPWPISFSFERALQKEAIEVWKGQKENMPAAQEALLKRAEKVSLARQGLLE
jgi:fructose-bisphosphate aldolase class I